MSVQYRQLAYWISSCGLLLRFLFVISLTYMDNIYKFTLREKWQSIV